MAKEDRDDRRIHAVLAEGEIVRYDTEGKWYYEEFRGGEIRVRRKLTLNEAVQFVSDSNQWNQGVPGGKVFDRRLAQKFEARKKFR